MSNKTYRLLKDLPFAKAGEIFKGMHDGGIPVLAPKKWGVYRHRICINDIGNFDEWFEEIESKGWAINTLSSRVEEILNTSYSKWAIRNLNSLGLVFETEQEADKHLKWLKARVVLLEDIKEKNVGNRIGDSHLRYIVAWDKREERLIIKTITNRYANKDVSFIRREDIHSSIELHEKEWKIYLGVK